MRTNQNASQNSLDCYHNVSYHSSGLRKLWSKPIQNARIVWVIIYNVSHCIPGLRNIVILMHLSETRTHHHLFTWYQELSNFILVSFLYEKILIFLWEEVNILPLPQSFFLFCWWQITSSTLVHEVSQACINIFKAEASSLEAIINWRSLMVKQ